MMVHGTGVYQASVGEALVQEQLPPPRSAGVRQKTRATERAGGWSLGNPPLVLTQAGFWLRGAKVRKHGVTVFGEACITAYTTEHMLQA